MKEKQSCARSEEKEEWERTTRSLISPYHNPGNVTVIGWHEPGEAVAPIDLCG